MEHESTLYQKDLLTITRSAVGTDTTDIRIPGLTILAHPDLERIGERSLLTGLASKQDVFLSRLEPLFTAPGESRRLPLADPHLSRRPVTLSRTETGIRLSTEPTATPVSLGGEPIESARLLDAAQLENGLVLLLSDRVALLLHAMMPVLPRQGETFGIEGASAGIVAVRHQLMRIAELDVPVILLGEAGSGKETAARALHGASKRRSRPFVAFDMATLEPAAAARELFGETSRRFHRARGGTLFLDRIAAAPLEVQTLLLSALESGQLRPAGAAPPADADVRILAATDAHLPSEITAGRFRAPLYHRLSGCEIRLPPLRERRDDVGRLLHRFLKEQLDACGETWPGYAPRSAARPWLPAPLVARLTEYPWPGNVRELKNVARQLVLANRRAPQLRITAEIEALLDNPLSGTGATLSLAEGAEAGRAVVKTLLLTDLVASTQLTEGLGDERFSELMSRHDHTARRLLAELDGREIDKTDGFLLLFERPVDAVDYALRYHRSLAELSRDFGVDLRARAGIHMGEVLLRRNAPDEVARGAKTLDVEGHAKAIAVKLVSLAAEGRTLLTRGAYDRARRALEGEHPLASLEMRWRRHGEVVFDGTPEASEVFEVSLSSQEDAISHVNARPTT